MDEPSLKTSRRALAAAIAAALVLGGGGFLLGRATTPADDPGRGPADAGRPTPAPLTIPTWVGPVTRPDLLSLAGLAADAAAAGLAPDATLAQSEGRRFEIRLPFGCDGPAPAEATTGWRYDEAAGTLRVFATPQRWSADDWLQPATSTEGIESIEGFWIERPWTSSEACPARERRAEDSPTEDASTDNTESASEAANTETANETTGENAEAPPPPPASAPPTLAVGQIYTTGSPRSGRRGGEAYRTVARVASENLDTSQGFRLRISGRLARAVGAAPAICRQDDPARRPVCLMTATIDDVAIENPATGETLATWSVGQRNTPASD